MTSWPGFKIDSEDRDGAAWVLVAGELDISRTDHLAEELAHAAESAARVVLDLSAVTFCDSSGLAALLRARRRHPEMTLVAGDAVLHVAQLGCVDEALFGPPAEPDAHESAAEDAASR